VEPWRAGSFLAGADRAGFLRGAHGTMVHGGVEVHHDLPLHLTADAHVQVAPRVPHHLHRSPLYMVASPPPSIAALGGGNPRYGVLGGGGGGPASEAGAKAARFWEALHRASEVRRWRGWGSVEWSVVDSNKEGGEQERGERGKVLVGQVLLSCCCCMRYGELFGGPHHNV
jgi:hypothetical protein